MKQNAERGTPAWWDQCYQDGNAPWDQGVVAPEVLAFTSSHPGNGSWAIDIGCGTGTQGRELARCGYQVVGVDLSGVALRTAQAAAQDQALPWFGVQAQAVDIGLFARAFQMALDIGCLHNLEASARSRYARALAKILAPGAYYLLYAFHPWPHMDGGGASGIEPVHVRRLFSPCFQLIWQQQGSWGDRKSDWWLWTRSR